MVKSFTRKFLSLFLATLLLVVLLAPAKSVSADSDTVNYSYLLGTGLLCGLGPDACPDISIASNGDKVEIKGEGTLSIHPKSVTGGGTFVHKDANGNILGSGTWTALSLLEFNGYGCGFDGFPDFCGGRAQIKVHLSVGLDAVLWVDCLIGSPPAGAMEGVRLSIPGVINFNKEVSGDTLFIRK